MKCLILSRVLSLQKPCDFDILHENHIPMTKSRTMYLMHGCQNVNSIMNRFLISLYRVF